MKWLELEATTVNAPSVRPSSNPNMRQWLVWTTYAVGQIGIQAVNVISGLLLVRTMHKTEYAWLTICLLAQSTISVLADCGLSSALSSLGGPVVTDAIRFNTLARRIQTYRVTFLTLVSLVVVPGAAYLLLRTGAPLVPALVALLMVVASARPATESVVYASTAKLRSQTHVLTLVELVSSLVRLGIIATLALRGVRIFGALFATAVAQWVAWGCYRSTIHLHPANSSVDPAWEARIRQLVRHSVPLVLFSCVQGQIGTFILASFATAGQVADLGALSRLAFAFSVARLPIEHFALPSLARVGDSGDAARVAWRTLGWTGALFVSIWAIGSLSSKPLLWVLGDQYGHLSMELVIYLGSLSVGAFAATAWGVALARGWVRHGWLQIPLALLFMFAGAKALDPAVTSTVIAYSAIPSLAALIVALGLIGRATWHRSPSNVADADQLGSTRRDRFEH